MIFRFVVLILLLCNHALAQSDWMGDSLHKIGNRSLFELTLPGTHDSAAYNLTSTIMPDDDNKKLELVIKDLEELHIPVDKIITAWAKTQDKNIYQQLLGGIRYLDLRCGYLGGKFVSFHLVTGEPIVDLLKDVKKFLDLHPKEFIIVELSHLEGNPPASELQRLLLNIEDIFAGYLLEKTADLKSPLKNFIDVNKRILITFADDQASGSHLGIWPQNTILNSYANTDKIDKMVEYNKRQVRYFKNYLGQSLYKISWILTPNAKTIINGIIKPGYPKSLIKLADTANKDALDDFIKQQQNSTYPILGNIFIIDHFESSNIVDICQPK